MGWLAGALLAALVFLVVVVGLLAQPVAPWWFGRQTAASSAVMGVGSSPILASGGSLVPGAVTDADRYALALRAGWSGADAITAAAISMAEDPSGATAARHHNDDGSTDIGLWQVNSRWWPIFGGEAALTDPAGNAAAAHAIYGQQGWGAWSMYRNGGYAAYVGRVLLAALAGDTGNDWSPAALANAQAWLGVPYLWGGCSRRGIDCSCFVQTVLASVGIAAPRTTVEQQRWATPVSLAAVQPGDLLFFDNTCTGCGPNPTHVGMWIGGGQMIQAGDPVQVTPLAGYWAAHLASVGRPRR